MKRSWKGKERKQRREVGSGKIWGEKNVENKQAKVDGFPVLWEKQVISIDREVFVEWEKGKAEKIREGKERERKERRERKEEKKEER